MANVIPIQNRKWVVARGGESAVYLCAADCGHFWYRDPNFAINFDSEESAAEFAERVGNGAKAAEAIVCH